MRTERERTNWTLEPTLDDGLGHGSFVAGVIAGDDPACPGLAPEADLYFFRVFTNDQVSYTSWFLDAFNYAIASGVEIINLSIGGPDYLDLPFVDKVAEVTASGITIVSAIGNDGPAYGTLNNPADRADIVGVGAITYDDAIAEFSSRGMVTWDLPSAIGGPKPDIVAYGKEVAGARITGGCRVLSGTSVASPVVAGMLALVASTLTPSERMQRLNPATAKQALLKGARRLQDGIRIVEQGAGALEARGAAEALTQIVRAESPPGASVHPASLDLTDCPYLWPYCAQPLYAGALPVMINVTILNGGGVVGRLQDVPVFVPEQSSEENNVLDIQFTYSETLWPWSGYLTLYLRLVVW